MGTVHACHPSSLHHHLLSLYPCPHHHSDLSAREPSSVARKWATAKQLFIPHEPRRSRLGVRRRCLDSERLSLCRGRRPARRPLRQLPRRGRRRRRRRHPSSGAVASKSMYLHRLGAALEAATPSLSSTSLLVEVSSERAAQMEGEASGCDGACVGDGLGLAHDGPWA